MNWYVYSSGLDTETPPKLTTEQVVALIKDKTIGKNAQVMRSDDPTKSWIKITDTEFAKTFASLQQLESTQKAAQKTQRQAEQTAARAQRKSDKTEKALANLETAKNARRQTKPSATNRRRSTSGSTTNRFFKLFRNSFYGASSPYTIGNERYPNLTRYLAIMDTFIRVFFAIVQIALILAVVFSIFTGLYFIVSNPFGYTKEYELREWNQETDKWETVLNEAGEPVIEHTQYFRSTFFEGLGAIIAGIAGGAISYLVLLWWRLLSLASLEMIHVFVDNESNTRKALEK